MEELKKEIESIKDMCKPLEIAIKAELAKGIESIDAHEFGEAVDALKDMSEIVEKKSKTAYYCSIVEAMEKADKEEELMDKVSEYLPETESERRFYSCGSRRYMNDYRRYPEYVYYDDEMNRDPYRDTGRMYYNGNSGTGMNNSSGNMSGGNTSGRSTNGMDGGSMRNFMESRYDRARRNYTEMRDNHKENTPEDKEMKMRELEKYMQELSSDITSLVDDMSQEEKNLLRNKINVLSTKI